VREAADTHHPYLVAVVGSPRPEGNTDYLVEVALADLRAVGVRCEKLVLADYRIQPCLGHDECADIAVCPHHDDAEPLLEKVYAADGLILATPVYYEDVSAQMKTFIDRNYRFYMRDRWLQPRAVGVIVVAGETGLDETVATLRRYLALSSQRELPVEVVSGLASAPGDAAAQPALLDDVRRMAAWLAAALLSPPSP
jgi:multimeric flavodoxin WrbA